MYYFSLLFLCSVVSLHAADNNSMQPPSSSLAVASSLGSEGDEAVVIDMQDFALPTTPRAALNENDFKCIYANASPHFRGVFTTPDKGAQALMRYHERHMASEHKNHLMRHMQKKRLAMPALDVDLFNSIDEKAKEAFDDLLLGTMAQENNSLSTRTKRFVASTAALGVAFSGTVGAWLIVEVVKASI